MLHDHIECGKYSAADVVAKAEAVLSEAELLRAEVGYFPPNTLPGRLRDAFSTVSWIATQLGDSAGPTRPCQVLSTLRTQGGE